MLQKSNSAVNLPRYENGISSSTLTNPLHRIVVQPSSAQKGMPSDPNQRTKETEKKKRIRKTCNQVHLKMLYMVRIEIKEYLKSTIDSSRWIK